ncbi:tetratricopeptide repeat protein, partial [Escherichia coli]|nr:tetratricopeptide repeat protein [Escherichia coli]
DSEKLYPQTDYSDDIAPREFTETDSLLAVKRLFDKQDYVGAINLARKILTSLPAFDDVRIFLGRSLLATGSIDEAEKEFRSVYDSK